MGRKGVSREEKLGRLKAIIFNGKSVYSLKEMEKLGKGAGIVQQAIKECMDELEYDNLIRKDKVGSGNFYYAFPSAQFVTDKKKTEAVVAARTASQTKTAALEVEIAELRVGREDSAERTELLRSVAVKSAEKEQLLAAMVTMEGNDPVVIDKLVAGIKCATDSATRWGDNCESLIDWCVKATNQPRKVICTHADIPEEGYPELTV